jgi:hypothetical protein
MGIGSSPFPFDVDGIAKFVLFVYPGTEDPDFVSVYSFLNSITGYLEDKYTRPNMPLNHSHSFALLNSRPEHKIIAETKRTEQLFFNGLLWGYNQFFTYTGFVRSMYRRCATFRYVASYYSLPE